MSPDFLYDIDRLTSDQQAGLSVAIGTVNYGYDAGSRRTSMNFTPSGGRNVTASYVYDPVNNLLGIKEGMATVCMTYDEADRQVSAVYPDGVTSTDSPQRE